MKTIYPEEKGNLEVHGCKMRWIFRRSKGESAFGIKGSRIYELKIYKDDKLTLEYERGYSIRPKDEDFETNVTLKHLLETFGKEKRKEKK